MTTRSKIVFISVEISKVLGDPIIQTNLWQPGWAGYFSGILRDKTMSNKLIYIPNDNTQNYPFCRLQLVVESFKHST